MTVKDVYKMNVLGEGSPFRDQGIESFSNENFLRFKYPSLYPVTKTKTNHRMTTSAYSRRDCCNSQMNVFPIKNRRIGKSAKFPPKYWMRQLSMTTFI